MHTIKLNSIKYTIIIVLNLLHSIILLHFETSFSMEKPFLDLIAIQQGHQIAYYNPKLELCSVNELRC